MSLSANDVAIDRLRVSGPRLAASAAVAEVQRAVWPQARGEEWIILREVRVKAPQPWLGLRASGTARRLVDGAVAGGAPGADRAQAVRFASLSELLAYLCVDLACGRRRWFWRRWASLFDQPAGVALRRVFADRLAHLPTIAARLVELGRLAEVWQALPSSEAQELMTLYAHHIGLDLSSPRAGSEAAAKFAGRPLPMTFLNAWSPAVGSLPSADSRRRLAVLMIAVQWQPVVLFAAPFPCLAEIDRALGGAAATPLRPVARPARPQESADDRIMPDIPDEAEPAATTRAAAPIPDRTSPSEADRPSVIEPAAQPTVHRQEESTAPPSVAAVSVAAKASSRPTASGPAGQEGGSRGSPAMPLPQSAPNEVAALRSRANAADFDMAASVGTWSDEIPAIPMPGVSIAERRFATAFGGLFYLINFINRPPVQHLFNEQDGWLSLPDGWAWLYRLGNELGLESADPVGTFLAECMGLDDPGELDALPVLPLRKRLLALAQRLYPDGLWAPDLIRVPASISHTPSHLDVHFALADVRLPVRLAGLDLNPGWVPWLGRVVGFHYLDAPS